MCQSHGAGITEELKENDQMKWVGLMNNVRSAVEEIMLKELVMCDDMRSGKLRRILGIMWMSLIDWHGIIFLLLRETNRDLVDYMEGKND